MVPARRWLAVFKVLDKEIIPFETLFEARKALFCGSDNNFVKINTPVLFKLILKVILSSICKP